MKRIWTILPLISVVGLVLSAPASVLAQEEQPTIEIEPLTIITPYPIQEIGIGEIVTLDLALRATSTPIVARLEVDDLPTDWVATFRGGGRVIQAVYVEPGTDTSVDLRLEPPENLTTGTLRFVVLASGGGVRAELPIELTVKEKAPPKLSFEVELPTLRGTPTTTFRYNVTLKNEGDEDLTVNLLADAPNSFLVSFKLTAQDVTNIPLGANESKRLSVEAEPIGDIPGGTYPITVNAQGGEASATIELIAEVIGQAELNITSQDGRLSGQAYAGRENPLKVLVQNTGTAPARGIELTATSPSGWSVEFEPKLITDISSGKQVEVTANVKPAEKAVAGDYMITIRAAPAEGPTESVEFRITVLTSTLWGVVGIALIAVAVGVVAVAVVRFGRR